jgi:hypothetical protein
MKKIVVLFLVLFLYSLNAHAGIIDWFDWITGKVGEQINPQEQETIKKPDLVVDSIATDISKITTADKFTIKVGIKNNGNLDISSGTDIAVHITLSNYEPFVYTLKEGLKAGIVFPITTSSYSFANEGEYKINVKADVNQAIEELDESNNEKSISFYVTKSPITIPPTQPTEPITIIKEKVQCNFLNSNAEQKCYANEGKFSCSGITNCIVETSGQKDEPLYWKSSCNNEYHTKIDFIEEKLDFKCEIQKTEPIPPVTQPIPQIIPSENIYEEVICIFHNSNKIQECVSQDNRFTCSGVDKCIMKINGQKNQEMYFKSNCQKQEYPPYVTIDGIPENIWFNCQDINAIVSPVPAPSPYASITEQVKCVFIDPDPMLKHSCGTSGGSCTWIWDGIKTETRDERMSPLLEKEINGQKVKYALCTAEVIGTDGEKKTWRSSCGGEIDTVMDKNNEEIEFKCLSDRQVNIEQLTGRGFRNAFWYCQGGAGVGLGNEETCKTADAWKRLAEEYCANSCHKTILGTEKCGLYSFSVSKECYFATEAERKEAELMPITGKELKMREISPPKMMASVLIYSYVGDCQECKELESLSENKIPLKIEDREKTTDFRYADFNYKQFLDKYPNENVLLYLNIMTEVTEGKAKAYAKVYELPKKINYKIMEEWWRNQVLTDKINPVYDTLSDKVITAPKIENDFLIYYYSGDCQECKELENIQKEIGEKPVVIKLESSGATSLSLSIVATLKSFLEENKNKNYLIYGMYSGDNDLSLYAKAGKADYLETAEWIRQIRAGKLSPAGIVGKTEEEIKKQLKEVEEEITICKDSCPLNNKCYPFSYRKGGKYCSDEGSFKEQLKENEICENNFECSTNLCIDGKCIGSNLIQKVFSWLKTLFALEKEKIKENATEVINCELNTECMENAFKSCKLAKLVQGNSVSEITGIEDKKCVLKITIDSESMICRFENYMLGTRNLGYTPEKYCEGGDLIKKLSLATKQSQPRLTKPIEETKIQEMEQIRKENISRPIRPNEVSKEQVKCKFIDPNIVQRCYADFGKLECSSTIKKCYTDDNKFGCSWAGGIASKQVDENKFLYVPECIAEVYGNQGTKLTWKGSCGEDSSTIIDMNNDEITFMCTQSGNEIKGFLYADWECKNGIKEKSIKGVDLTTCKSSEIWEEYAEKSCKNQGGLKDYSVSNKCSIISNKEGISISS